MRRRARRALAMAWWARGGAVRPARRPRRASFAYSTTSPNWPATPRERTFPAVADQRGVLVRSSSARRFARVAGHRPQPPGSRLLYASWSSPPPGNEFRCFNPRYTNTSRLLMLVSYGPGTFVRSPRAARGQICQTTLVTPGNTEILPVTPPGAASHSSVVSVGRWTLSSLGSN